jgi:hypothetical protein
MSTRYWRVLGGVLLGLGMAVMAVFTSRATHVETTAAPGTAEWRLDTLADFAQGTMDGVDVWTQPGAVRLDRAAWPNARVNSPASQGRFAPSLSFLLSDTHAGPETHFVAVWADERVQDHNPDIYFATSANRGRTWSPDRIVGGSHVSGRSQNTPDIAPRAADESLWVVWQDDRRDAGDIFFATSSDRGAHWSAASPVYTGTGTQSHPRIASDARSGRMFSLWESASAGDDGDIVVSSIDPDASAAWSGPVRVNDDGSSATQSDPNLAVDGEGNLYAVWEDTRDDPDGQDTHVYFSRWMSGTTWGDWSANTRLSDPDVDWAGDPDVVAAPGGALYAAWYERVPTGPATYDFQIVVATSQDNGATWSRAIVRRLHNASASLANFQDPVIGADRWGRVYVAWQHSPDQQAATANILLALSPDGGAHWTQPRILNLPANHAVLDDVPALAVGFDGELVAAWQDYRDTEPHIFASGYPADRYLPRGEYRAELDAGGLAGWGAITWTAGISPNTGLALATRVMTGLDGGWTGWVTHTSSGAALGHPPGFALQLRAILTGNGFASPALEQVLISYQRHRLYLPLMLGGGS